MSLEAKTSIILRPAYPSQQLSAPFSLFLFPFFGSHFTVQVNTRTSQHLSVWFDLPTRRLTGSPRYAHPAFSISSQLCSCCLPSQPRSQHSFIYFSRSLVVFEPLIAHAAFFTPCPFYDLIHTPNHPSFALGFYCNHWLSSASSNHIPFLGSDYTSIYITNLTTFTNAAYVYASVGIESLDATRFDNAYTELKFLSVYDLTILSISIQHSRAQ